jgi:hypothetical protein
MKTAAPTIVAASPIGLMRIKSKAMAPAVPSNGSSMLDAQTGEMGINDTIKMETNKTTKAFFADFNMALSIRCTEVFSFPAWPHYRAGSLVRQKPPLAFLENAPKKA